MALACGADNRLVGEGGYTTTITARGDVEWQPPPDLDHGQARLNYHHRPELLLRPPDDPDTVPPATGSVADEGALAAASSNQLDAILVPPPSRDADTGTSDTPRNLALVDAVWTRLRIVLDTGGRGPPGTAAA
jgi:hypothetical protein